MKIVTIVGARPQFIKAAAVSRVLRASHEEILVHTGQHYDKNMSDIFFEELHIPKPDRNLGVGSASHGKQTADMLAGIEQVLLVEKPDCLLIYGDTNSTLAGAVAASKLLIPVAHVEAGLRSFNKSMPEEQNRILADHISSLLFCPTDTAMENLRREGIDRGIYQVGDVMCDAVQYYSGIMEGRQRDDYFGQLKGLFGEIPSAQRWYTATIHRAENTDAKEKVEEILAALEELDAPVIFPVHPRIRGIVTGLYEEKSFKNIMFVQPVGYLAMLYLVKHSVRTITDSGGLQKETYMLGTPCITVRDQTEWKETLTGNWNILAKPCKDDILRKVYDWPAASEERKPFYGDGRASEKICALLDTVN